MLVTIDPSWKNHLEPEFHKPYFKQLVEFVKQEYANYKVYPPGKYIFRAFELCPFYHTKVVILGQDPYHGHGQAHGLCFSVNDGMPLPPSLLNIFKEIQTELGIPIPLSGNLARWARQGVLLLNATLTVRAGKPGSHQKKGWETFTDAVIRIITQHKTHIVFLLWGAYAQQKASFIDMHNNLVLSSAHPSPYSVAKGFFGNNHFRQTNEYLRAHGLTPIEW
jgi:uracil-DNA glycosylase